MVGRLLRKNRAKLGAKRQSTGNVRVNKSLEFLAEHFCRPIQLKDMVAKSGMSRRGFCKAFLAHVGANPGRILRQVRLEYAKRLLMVQDLTLKEIASQCGFRSVNSFCVAFQRTMGIPPKKFQKQYLLNVCRFYRNDGNQTLKSNSLFAFCRGISPLALSALQQKRQRTK